MQIFTFESTNGYVIHRLKSVYSNCRISAWFDADGTMIDAERVTRKNVCLPVKKGSNLYADIQIKGKLYNPNNATN